ncbi:MAG: hypothetical protein MJ078_01970 [Clostridia bacterium]|nr:hypothetical protein [Clostridia bacterium]
MKFTAHRGASLLAQENTLKSLTLGAERGAFAVECDLRVTADGVKVFFHDEDLFRLTGVRKKVSDVTFSEMKRCLGEHGLTLTDFDTFCREYTGNSLVLLDLANGDEPLTEAFFRDLLSRNIPFIVGIHTPGEAAAARAFFPSSRILAFMPSWEAAGTFYRAGAGLLRLWENWLDKVTPGDIRRICPNAEIFIMANAPESGNNGSKSSLDRIAALGADGVLLNDIDLALAWEREK